MAVIYTIGTQYSDLNAVMTAAMADPTVFSSATPPVALQDITIEIPRAGFTTSVRQDFTKFKMGAFHCTVAPVPGDGFADSWDDTKNVGFPSMADGAYIHFTGLAGWDIGCGGVTVRGLVLYADGNAGGTGTVPCIVANPFIGEAYVFDSIMGYTEGESHRAPFLTSDPAQANALADPAQYNLANPVMNGAFTLTNSLIVGKTATLSDFMAINVFEAPFDSTGGVVLTAQSNTIVMLDVTPVPPAEHGGVAFQMANKRDIVQDCVMFGFLNDLTTDTLSVYWDYYSTQLANNATSLSAFKSPVTNGLTGITSDVFVAAQDYRVITTSALVGKGSGKQPTVDILGRKRTMNTLGCFEAITSAALAQPPAPPVVTPPVVTPPVVTPPVVTPTQAAIAAVEADIVKLTTDWGALKNIFSQLPVTPPVVTPPVVTPPVVTPPVVTPPVVTNGSGSQTNIISSTPPASIPTQVLRPNSMGIGPYTVYVGATRPMSVLPTATTPGQFTYLSVAMSYASSLNQQPSGQPGMDPVHFHFILDAETFLNDFATYNNVEKFGPLNIGYVYTTGFSNWVGKLDFPCIIECQTGKAILQQNPPGPGSQLNQGGLIATGWDVTFRNLHFTGFCQNVIGDPGNLRAIAFEAGHPPANFILDGVEIDTCDDGFLGPSGGSSLYVRKSYFHNNGSGTGNTHNLYVDDVVWAVFEDVLSTNCAVGHLLKCRGSQTIIRGTVRLIGEGNPAGTWLRGSPASESYCLDVPDAGIFTIEAGATLICAKSDGSQNFALIHYSGENQDAAGVPFHVPASINILGTLIMIGNKSETVTVRGSSAPISGLWNQSGAGASASGLASFPVTPTISGSVQVYGIPAGAEGFAPVTVLTTAPQLDLTSPV